MSNPQSPANKAWVTRRSSVPAYVKAQAIGRWAETIFRALSSRVANRWRFISFRGQAKGEWKGIVDVLAIRKDSSRPKNPRLSHGDLFDIILVQIKGGSAARPTLNDCARLQQVARYYRAKAVVQFQWRKGVSSKFFELDPRTLKWKPTTGSGIFE